MSTSEYVVLKPIRHAGRTIPAGGRVALTARQAKWMLLSGKVVRAGAAGEPATGPVRPKAAVVEAKAEHGRPKAAVVEAKTEHGRPKTAAKEE
jgi:hypothetical protein